MDSSLVVPLEIKSTIEHLFATDLALQPTRLAVLEHDGPPLELP